MADFKSLKEQAYAFIKHNILTNVWPPNQYLDEKMLGEMLNISRTPIREAINILEWEQLVQVIPKKGIFVTNISVQSVNDLFESRCLIEPMILRLAYPNMSEEELRDFRQRFVGELNKDDKDYIKLHWMDYEFHNYISEHCGNMQMAKMVNQLSDHFQRVRTQPFYEVQRTIAGAEEHILLIDYLLQGNIEVAVNFLKEHIRNTQKYYLKSSSI